MKVLFKLHVYAANTRNDVVPSKNISLKALRTDTLGDVLRNAIQKAGWNEDELRTRSIRFFDEDFYEYVDIGDDAHPADLGKYEVDLESIRRPEVRRNGCVPGRTKKSRAHCRLNNVSTPDEFCVELLSGQLLAFSLLTG